MVYLLFDTALNEEYTRIQLQALYPLHSSLFEGTQDETLLDVAPYLFLIDAEFPEKVKNPLYRLDDVIYIETAAGLEELRTHFQQFIYRRVHQQAYYFRFWDARVFKKYADEQAGQSMELFFGPCEALLLDDAAKQGMLRYSLSRQKNIVISRLARNDFFASITIQSPTKPEQPVPSVTSDSSKPKRRFFIE